MAFSRTTVQTVTREGVGGELNVASAALSRPAAGFLMAPLESLVPSSPFGLRTSPLTGFAGEFHWGQDFAAPCGTRVYSADAGVVRAVGWHPWGGGNRVEIDHGNGLITTYNHLQGIAVKKGDSVRVGEVIALVGTTGSSTGCHLHFETILNGSHTDPMDWKFIPIKQVDQLGPHPDDQLRARRRQAIQHRDRLGDSRPGRPDPRGGRRRSGTACRGGGQAVRSASAAATEAAAGKPSATPAATPTPTDAATPTPTPTPTGTAGDADADADPDADDAATPTPTPKPTPTPTPTPPATAYRRRRRSGAGPAFLTPPTSSAPASASPTRDPGCRRRRRTGHHAGRTAGLSDGPAASRQHRRPRRPRQPSSQSQPRPRKPSTTATTKASATPTATPSRRPPREPSGPEPCPERKPIPARVGTELHW